MNAIGIDVSKGKAWLPFFALMVGLFPHPFRFNIHPVKLMLKLSISNP